MMFSPPQMFVAHANHGVSNAVQGGTRAKGSSVPQVFAGAKPARPPLVIPVLAMLPDVHLGHGSDDVRNGSYPSSFSPLSLPVQSWALRKQPRRSLRAAGDDVLFGLLKEMGA